ncbi:thiolase family protein [Novosphingobium malaysiense]|uniref:Diterpenoid dioxygenase n=1 Tax=Novosphingobium malaysiense TaxID=1348853 RepID=A0A0B1ZHX3_9SPHN|nr:thiolase family protein [Novosphingobium malaysiense]KHK88952.1 diterpenoid dioxygenase [Novosphingobium malaysiense]
MAKAPEAYVTGVGQSEVGVRLKRHPMLLTVDAIKEALSDAGLTIGQIDGVSTYPGKSPGFLGFSPVGADELIDTLGIRARWFAGGAEISSQLGAVVAAVGAIRLGLARHVICFRTVYEAAAMADPVNYPSRFDGGRVSGMQQWELPFNAISAAIWIGQYAERHVRKYGMTREQLAQIALTGSANAMLNPCARAITKKQLTMDDYMTARMICSPFCLWDCDRFTDAATVLIVSAEDALDEVKATPVRIASYAGSAHRHNWDQEEWVAAYHTGPEIWRHTDYRVEDVDMVQLYDGFSFNAITWLEGLGFCDWGEGHHFIDGGSRIARDGQLPLNTNGGQLGAGRLHGFGFAHEAVVQLRGEGGERQVPRDPKVAIAASGGGPMATALLLARD